MLTRRRVLAKTVILSAVVSGILAEILSSPEAAAAFKPGKVIGKYDFTIESMTAGTFQGRATLSDNTRKHGNTWVIKGKATTTDQEVYKGKFKLRLLNDGSIYAFYERVEEEIRTFAGMNVTTPDSGRTFSGTYAAHRGRLRETPTEMDEGTITITKV